MVVRRACGGGTAAHELGHLVGGLWHTHHRQDGSTCDTSGDRCCSTPDDPGPPAALPEGLGTCRDNGHPACTASCPGSENPDTTDSMSYYACGRVPGVANFAGPGSD